LRIVGEFDEHLVYAVDGAAANNARRFYFPAHRLKSTAGRKTQSNAATQPVPLRTAAATQPLFSLTLFRQQVASRGRKSHAVTPKPMQQQPPNAQKTTLPIGKNDVTAARSRPKMLRVGRDSFTSNISFQNAFNRSPQ
jgi:hypothetical protein